MSQPTDARRAAAAALGLEPDAGTDQARARFLRRVEEGGLVPDRAVVAAAAEFGVIEPGPGRRAALDADVERDLGGAVERFADSYWDLDPEVRQVRWSELAAEAGDYPRLAARLGGLSAGLDIIRPAETSDTTGGRLIALVYDLYPRKPADRAARRVDRLSDIGQPGALRSAAQGIRRTYPEVRRIDHGLLEELVIGRALATPIRRSIEGRRERPAETVRTTSGGGGNWNWWWVAIPICMCLGAIGRSSRTSSDHDRYAIQQPQRNPDPWRDRQAGRPAAGLTKSQIDMLRDLARRPDLTRSEAASKAVIFQALGLVGPSFQKANMPDGQWVTTPDPSFTLAQQDVQARLAVAGADVDRIRDLLIEFVRAGRTTNVGTGRP